MPLSGTDDAISPGPCRPLYPLCNRPVWVGGCQQRATRDTDVRSIVWSWPRPRRLGVQKRTRRGRPPPVLVPTPNSHGLYTLLTDACGNGGSSLSLVPSLLSELRHAPRLSAPCQHPGKGHRSEARLGPKRARRRISSRPATHAPQLSTFATPLHVTNTATPQPSPPHCTHSRATPPPAHRIPRPPGCVQCTATSPAYLRRCPRCWRLPLCSRPRACRA